MHSAITVLCSKQQTILEIVTRLEQMAEKQALKSELLTLDSILGLTIGRQGNVFPLALQMTKQLGDFAALLVNAQVAQLIAYNCTPHDSGGLMVHLVFMSLAYQQIKEELHRWEQKTKLAWLIMESPTIMVRKLKVTS